MKKLAVFCEAHKNGEPHYHVAILLSGPYMWGPAKRTLRERDGLAAHFSSSHNQLWSAVRYGFVATLKEPVVDASPCIWSDDGSWPNGTASAGSPGASALWEAAQRPWTAAMWKSRSEQAQKASLEGGPKRRITKLDVTAIIVEKGMKTPTEVMAYVQDHGSESLQQWVHSNQKKLKGIGEEAWEWADARERAAADREPDWDCICRHAQRVCPHGDTCP